MAKEEASGDQTQFLIADLNTRLRDIDERNRLIRERVLLIGQNLISSRQEVDEEGSALVVEVRAEDLLNPGSNLVEVHSIAVVQPVHAHRVVGEEAERPDLHDPQADRRHGLLKLVPTAHLHPLRSHADTGQVLGGDDSPVRLAQLGEVSQGLHEKAVLGYVEQHVGDIDHVLEKR